MKVQAILDARPSGGQQRKRRKYLLSGLLWSADYQVAMVGVTAKQRYTYYRAKVGDLPELLIPEHEAEAGIVAQLHGVSVNGADLSAFPSDLRLALSVAPSVGVVYQALELPEARRALLTGVVSRAVVSGRDVTGLELRAGFKFDSARSGRSDYNPHAPQIMSLLIYSYSASEVAL